MANEVTNFVMHGHNFRSEEVRQLIYPGFEEAEIELLSRLGDPDARPEPGFLVDIYGIKTRVTSIWPEARALEGLLLGHPFPGNWHWEATEWVGIMRAVLEAGDQFRIMELGAGWGPASVSSGVLARLKGIPDIRITAVEGDPHHFGFLQQHLSDNGFDPLEHRLYEAAVAVEAGIAKWPVTADSSSDYGFRPLEGQTDYLDRHWADTRDVTLLSIRDLVRSEDRWDMIHIDIQGTEVAVCAAAMPELVKRAKRVMIGTHSRKIEGDLIDLFVTNGWILENEKPCQFRFRVGAKSLEAMTHLDGNQTWMNPAI